MAWHNRALRTTLLPLTAVTPTGVEQARQYSTFRAVDDSGGEFRGMPDDLRQVVDSWELIPEMTREIMVRLVGVAIPKN